VLNEKQRAKLQVWAKAKPRGPLPSRFVSRKAWLASLSDWEREKVEREASEQSTVSEGKDGKG